MKSPNVFGHELPARRPQYEFRDCPAQGLASPVGVLPRSGQCIIF